MKLEDILPECSMAIGRGMRYLLLGKRLSEVTNEKCVFASTGSTMMVMVEPIYA